MTILQEGLRCRAVANCRPFDRQSCDWLDVSEAHCESSLTDLVSGSHRVETQMVAGVRLRETDSLQLDGVEVA